MERGGILGYTSESYTSKYSAKYSQKKIMRKNSIEISGHYGICDTLRHTRNTFSCRNPRAIARRLWETVTELAVFQNFEAATHK